MSSPTVSTRPIKAILLLVAILLSHRAAEAQAFGQWWWSAQAGLAGLYRSNVQDGQTSNSYNRTGLLLTGDLNGHVLHPTVAGFRLGLEALLDNIDGSRFKSSDRLGGDVEFRLLPRSRFPGRLYAQHRNFGYEPTSDSLELFETEVPRSSTTLDGTWTLRRTPVGSLTFNANRVSTSFFALDSEDGLADRQSLTWGFSRDTFRHNLLVRRWRYEAGTYDYTRDGISAVLTENGTIGDDWRWNLTGSALDSSATYSSGEYEQQQYRGLGRISRSFREGHLLQLRGRGALYDSSVSGSQSDQAVRLTYLRQLTPHFSLQPYAEYSRVENDFVTRTRPSLGVGATWTQTGRKWSSILTGAMGFGKGQTRSEVSTETDSRNISYTAGLTVAHDSRVTKEFQFTLAHNYDTLEGFDREILPGFGLPLVTGAADQLYSRATFTVPHSLGTLRAWGDFNYQRANGTILGVASTQRSTQFTAENAFGRFTLGLLGGYTLFDAENSAEQELGYARLQGSWRASSFLTLNASYRASRRFPEFGPSVDGYTATVGLTLAIARFRLEVRGHEQSDEILASSGIEPSARRYRYLTINITRSFAGLLPIISAPQRSGTIR